MDATSVLLNTQSPDLAVRQAAEQQLEQAKASNLGALMLAMAAELANESKEVHVRQAAGLVVKNCLAAKEESRQEQLNAAWRSIDAGSREQIRNALLPTLGSPQQKARHTAAQAVAAIATVDLPNNEWPALVPGLVTSVTNPQSEFFKESSLEALGYICEETDPELLKPQSNQILTAVVQGMLKESGVEVRIAATTALLNALEFVQSNFENEMERNYIMQTVCETTQAQPPDARQQERFAKLRSLAYECIVRVAELYYDKLPAYMNALYQLTTGAIKAATEDKEPDEVGQQAIEFWTTICEEETELNEEYAEAKEQQQHGAVNKSHNFMRGAAPTVVPLLLESLCKQAEEEDDDETWNMAMVSGCCLSRAAITIEDEVVAIVMPFIEKYIQSSDWRRREASTLAFGSILEGPTQNVLKAYLAQGLEVVMSLMHDQSVAVRDTAAWTIGRICEHHIAVVTSEQWQKMTQKPGPQNPEGVLLHGLKDAPRVASNVCWTLHNLAEKCEESRREQTNALSPIFIELATALLNCTDRADAGENNLRSSAYEALNTTIANAAEDTKGAIEQLLPAICQRLQQTFTMQIVSNDDKETQCELQGLLCGCLQVITQKLEARVVPFCDTMMGLFLQVFGAKNATVHEEALMAVGSVANACEGGFEKYMPHFRPFLSLGLSNAEEHQVCTVAVGVVGDICRALEGKVLQYCDEFVALLLRNLQNPSLNRNVKPVILAHFGDIALAVGGHFEKYLAVTMQMLEQAGKTTVDMNNDDLVDYLNQLREGIFEAFTGVLQGLRADNKGDAFLPFVESPLKLIKEVAHPESKASDTLIRAAIGLVGDLAQSLLPFKQLAKQSPHKDYLKALLRTAKASSEEETRQVAKWAGHLLA